MTQSALCGYTTCDFSVSFSLYSIFCRKMEALARINTKITRYSYPNFRSCSLNSSQSWGREAVLIFRDISIMPTWAEEAQRSIWDWQMDVLVYLRLFLRDHSKIVTAQSLQCALASVSCAKRKWVLCRDWWRQLTSLSLRAELRINSHPEFSGVKTKDFVGMEEGIKLLNYMIKQF